MKRRGFLGALIALLPAVVALLATQEVGPSLPGGFALVSEPSLRALGWEVEADPHEAEWLVAEIANRLGLAPDRPGEGVSMLVWQQPDSAGVVEIRQARIALIGQVLYTFASPAEARRACEALPHRLIEWQYDPQEEVHPEVRSFPIAGGRGHLVVNQTPFDTKMLFARSLWLIGCRGSAVMLLGILSTHPQVPLELLPHLQSMVLGG